LIARNTDNIPPTIFWNMPISFKVPLIKLLINEMAHKVLEDLELQQKKLIDSLASDIAEATFDNEPSEVKDEKNKPKD